MTFRFERRIVDLSGEGRSGLIYTDVYTRCELVGFHTVYPFKGAVRVVRAYMYLPHSKV